MANFLLKLVYIFAVAFIAVVLDAPGVCFAFVFIPLVEVL